ncbi:hypothetical protein GEV27_10170 [Aeromicrobium sp. S22]|uniref:anti-sigma factor n=1 Tax=Aeromicrobium sp. S22 TaxID=2662029 RepID=UPI00129D6C35|nr:anti-sigma factor [Aeromicrobium sp. S22]MRK01887.1 hypothetical protein [Aeromicrobium sp. S22]
MNVDDHPDLFGLITGELPNRDATAAGSHLRRCDPCRRELAETAVGHALLTRSSRTLSPDPAGAQEHGALPPMVQPRARPRRVGVLVAAAAVLCAAAGGLALSVLGDDPSVPPTSAPRTLASASLLPVADGDAAVSGEAEVYQGRAGRTSMRISATDLPPAATGHFYYAWLLDPRTQKMLPLGQLGPDGGSFDVSDTTLAAYSAVDVSLEADDGDPGHSVTSVLRGGYQFDDRASDQGP